VKKMAEEFVLASTAISNGTALVIRVFRVASVELIAPLIIAAFAVAVKIGAVPRTVDPLFKETVDALPVAVLGVTSNPNTVILSGTGTRVNPAPVAAAIIPEIIFILDTSKF
jgi:hypothetical protein